RYRVGKINVRIRGEHPHTRHSTVLNRLSLRPGDILDIRKLRDDERRLKASSLFLADAAKGEGPRIVFSKPEGEDTQIARDPKRPGFRGQSPDGEDEAVLDLVLEGEWNPEDGPPPPVAAQPVWRGQSPQPMMQPMQPMIQPGMQPAQQAFGGMPLQPTGPEAVDYGRTVAPAPRAPAFVAQAPGQPGMAQPGVVQPVPFQAGMQPAMQPAQFQPGQFQPGMMPPPGMQPGMQPGLAPPGLAQPGMVPNFAEPLQVFPGQEPYVVVDVDAEETQTGRLMIGAGVNSNAGLVGNIVIDEQNFDITRLPQSWDDIRNGTAFRGAGQRFRLEAAPGTQLQRYTATFQEPYLFDTRIGLPPSRKRSGCSRKRWSTGRSACRTDTAPGTWPCTAAAACPARPRGGTAGRRRGRRCRCGSRPSSAAGG
ncbi:MAG: hypothetical protein ACKOK8_08710, partial [Planctomycetia bacterium]